MAILDLQGMEGPANGVRAGRSHGSKSCGGGGGSHGGISSLSVALC